MGSPPTGGAGRMALFCRVRRYRAYSFDAFIRLDDGSPTLVWSAIILLKNGDIVGGRDVVESFSFHATLILFYLKECQFYKTF